MTSQLSTAVIESEVGKSKFEFEIKNAQYEFNQVPVQFIEHAGITCKFN